MTTIHDTTAAGYEPEQDENIDYLADRFIWAASGSECTLQEFVGSFFDKECPDQPQNWRDKTFVLMKEIICHRMQAAQESAIREEKAVIDVDDAQRPQRVRRMKRIANGYASVWAKLEGGLGPAAMEAKPSHAA